MTEPPYGYRPADGPEGDPDPPQPPNQPVPYPELVPHPAPVPPHPAYLAPYGVDPITGRPFSEKSKTTAGLLQLLLGFLLGLGGVGRLYAGHTALGTIQLVATVVGWISFWCGFVLILPFFIFFGCWVWFVVDGIVLLAGRPTDGAGRLLRS